ncbi:MAG: hypothetical protein Q9160_002612 [Pyrenula sp. 1 TL-2023]
MNQSKDDHGSGSPRRSTSPSVPIAEEKPTGAHSVSDVQKSEEHNEKSLEAQSQYEEKHTESPVRDLPADVEKGGQPTDAISVSEEQDDAFIVFWDGPDDPANPQNWPAKAKWGNVLTGVVAFGGAFIMRETYPPIILQRRAKRLRNETGNDKYRSKLQTADSAKTLFMRAIIRPMKMLFRSPIVFFLTLFMSIVYGYLYLLFTTITEVFESTYQWSAGIVGLAFLGIGVGMFVGLGIFGAVSDAALKKKAAGGQPMKPEWRLPPMLPGAMMIPIGFFWYGWSAEKAIHWIMPIIGTGFVGLGLIGTFMPIQTYLVDAFTLYAASAVAANMVARSLVGAILPLAGRPLYEKLGLGWGNSLLGFIALAMIPTPLIFMRYGEYLRTSPKFKSLAASLGKRGGSSGCRKPLPSNHSPGGISQTEKITSGGRSRDYLIHIPASYTPDTPVPLILSFHGRTKDAAEQEQLSQFSNPAYNPNAIAVYPQGVANSKGTRQFSGDPDAPASINDILFTSDLIASLSSTYCLDPTRIYATGKSNGGGLVGLLACDPSTSRQIAAFAAVSGAFYLGVLGAPLDQAPACNPCPSRKGKIPFLEFHGLQDTTIPYAGGENASKRGSTIGIADYMNGWAARNGLDADTPTTVDDTLCTQQGFPPVTAYTWGDENGGLVRHYKISNLDHDWPSSAPNDDDQDGKYETCFEGAEKIMEFFGKWTLDS